MNLKTIDMPAHWACYLINGDESSLCGHDLYDCDKACAEANVSPNSCLDSGAEFIGRWRGMMTDLCTYTFTA